MLFLSWLNWPRCSNHAATAFVLCSQACCSFLTYKTNKQKRLRLELFRVLRRTAAELLPVRCESCLVFQCQTCQTDINAVQNVQKLNRQREGDALRNQTASYARLKHLGTTCRWRYGTKHGGWACSLLSCSGTVETPANKWSHVWHPKNSLACAIVTQPHGLCAWLFANVPAVNAEVRHSTNTTHDTPIAECE